MADLSTSSPAIHFEQFLRSIDPQGSDRELIERIAKADHAVSGVRVDGPAYELARLVAVDPTFTLPGRDRKRTEAIVGLSKVAVDELTEILQETPRGPSNIPLIGFGLAALFPLFAVAVFSLLS